MPHGQSSLPSQVGGSDKREVWVNKRGAWEADEHPSPTHLFAHSEFKRQLPLSLPAIAPRYLRPSQADGARGGSAPGKEERTPRGAWVRGR
ncbi:hypothetical protein CapIbe_011857 [Capra ibex]